MAIGFPVFQHSALSSHALACALLNDSFWWIPLCMKSCMALLAYTNPTHCIGREGERRTGLRKESGKVCCLASLLSASFCRFACLFVSLLLCWFAGLTASRFAACALCCCHC